MKKYVYALAAFLTLGFAACSSDDDEDNSIDTDVDVTEDVIYSFTNRNATMFQTASAEISLYKRADLAQYSAPKDLVFPVEVDVEKSTAVEGTHFSFAGEKSITVPSGKSKGSLKLNFIKKEEGKDEIVLTVKKPSDKFFLGDNASLTIKIVGEAIEVLKGTWGSCTWESSNKDYWGLSYDLSKFPSVSSEDQLTISDGGLEVNIKSDLKNYFVGNSEMKYIQEQIFRFPEDYLLKRTGFVFVLNNINANFSAQSSTIKDSRVAFAVIKDDNNEEVLEVIVYSYEPTDFLVEEYNGMKDFATEDEPAMIYYPLRYHFKRVQ